MTRIHKVVLVTVLTVVGVWGCAKSPQPGASADRLKQLEARVAKLEADLRTVTADRDATRASLAGSETRVAELERQVRTWTAKAGAAEKERDELVAKLKLRAAEHGRSAEAEHREILREALSREPRRRSFKELAARVRAMTAGRRQTPSEILLREGRDER